MKQRKTAENLDCGLNIAMKVFGAKWKPCIIDAINKGYKRPSEMHRVITSATPRVIDMQLKELELNGIVRKATYHEVPLRTEYSLTEVGLSLLPVIELLNDWGNKNKYLIQELYEPAI
jgi:DNA-binding HxlR family transcriptional regulator